MKKLILSLFLWNTSLIFGQISGNINYQSSIGFMPAKRIAVAPQSNQMTVSVRGLANLKPDFYVAIFGVTQFGETKEETIEKIDRRINNSIEEITKHSAQKIHVDMISFVPKYEWVEEKKIFSKKTYNEVPKGFEIKKNIHIQFSDPKELDDFMAILAQNEIYDIIRVDVFAKNLEDIKNEVSIKAKSLIKEKLKDYETILDDDFSHKDKSLTEGFSFLYPIEMYQSFTAYNSNSKNRNEQAQFNEYNKNMNIYYQPYQNKDFDFVENPVIVEPVIQVIYDINILLTKKPESTKKEFILITPNGELKKIQL